MRRLTKYRVEDLSAFDLSSAAGSLDSRFSKVRKQIISLQALQASLLDIEEVLENLTAMQNFILEFLADQPNGKWDASQQNRVIIRALLKSSVIAYARAVDGGARGRHGSPLIEMIDRDQLRDRHNRIIDVRNNAIAHYGVEASFESNWKSESVVLFSEPSGDCSIGFAFSRANTREHLIEDLQLCSQSLIRQGNERSLSLEGKLWTSLHWLRQNNLLEALLCRPGFEGLKPNTAESKLALLKSLETIPRRWEQLLSK